VVKAGCGGGGAGQYPGMIIYCHCYCTDNQYFTCCCFYINCCPFCNLAGCPGNGYLVIEW
jgi:hypothetical protein